MFDPFFCVLILIFLWNISGNLALIRDELRKLTDAQQAKRRETNPGDHTP